MTYSDSSPTKDRTLRREMGGEEPVRRRRVEPDRPMPDYEPQPAVRPARVPQPVEPEKSPV